MAGAVDDAHGAAADAVDEGVASDLEHVGLEGVLEPRREPAPAFPRDRGSDQHGEAEQAHLGQGNDGGNERVHRTTHAEA